MTKKLTLTSAAIAVSLLPSCTSYQVGLDAPSAHRDAMAGAAIGGIAGSIIGHQSGETRNGALIGAVLGGMTGYAVGEDKDRRWQEQGYQNGGQTYNSPQRWSQPAPYGK